MKSNPPPTRHTHTHTHTLTCGQEAVCGQQQLGGDLDPQLVLAQLEDGEVLLLPLMAGNTALGAVVSWEHAHPTNITTVFIC